MTTTTTTTSTPLATFERRPDATVQAIQINLDLSDGFFTYTKWKGTQKAKTGDWLLLNGDENYTVDAESFASTYREIEDRPGHFFKVATVFAQRADEPGSIPSKEGSTDYAAGDWLVYNECEEVAPDQFVYSDGYAMSPEKFDQLYAAA